MTKKNWIKIGIIVIIACVMCFSDFGFAANNDALSSSDLKFGEIGFFLNLITSILSWIWVIFAKLAGQFLTNKWVYGEVIGLDSLLRKWRVIIRNIANFGLGAYFIYVIFCAVKNFKEDITKKIKSTLIWILVAGIGIQASWFFVAAMIDVSTITMEAAGALPAQVISNNVDSETYIHQQLDGFVDKNFTVTTGQEYTLFPKGRNSGIYLEKLSVPVTGSGSKEKFIDMLIPTADDVSGPLYYIGFAILDTNINPSSIDFSSLRGIKTTILNLIIQGGTIIIYSIEMLVLCVLALMRIVYLRMFIVLSPIAILLWCITQSDKDIGEKMGGFIKSITKQINFKSFFINIFKPTIIVLGMGMALIFSILMSGEIKKDGGNYMDKDLGGMRISSQKNGDDTYTTTINSDFFKYSLSNAAKSLLEMIISIITVILMYFIIKIAVEIGKSEDFVSKNIKSLQDNIKKAMTSIPIVPVTGYDKNGSVKDAALSRDSIKTLPKDKIDKLESKVKDYESKHTENVMKGLGLIDDNSLTPTQERDITKMRTDTYKGKGLQILEKQKEYIDTIKSSDGKGMKLDSNATDKFWLNEFTAWLKSTNENDISLYKPNNVTAGNVQIWKDMVARWNRGENQNKSLDDLFGVDGVRGAAGAYAELFGLGTITDWDHLRERDISQGTPTKSS